MPWCPVCKNEYVEGKTHCPDCDVDLVAELPSEDEEYPDFPEDYPPVFPEDAETLTDPEDKPQMAAPTYVKPEDRYADTRSSAWTFLLVGLIGLTAAVLCWAGVLHFPIHNFALAVMTALFAIFLGIGIRTFGNAKKLEAAIEDENAFVDQVISWYHTEGCRDPELASLDPDLPVEDLYFRKSAIIQRILQDAYPQMNISLLEKLTDDFCEETYQ